MDDFFDDYDDFDDGFDDDGWEDETEEPEPSIDDAEPENDDGMDWDAFTLGVGLGIEMGYRERNRNPKS